jgi:NAD(P)-dependent dehydrogenase (short-subunit alcohol dehydrogenase family)
MKSDKRNFHAVVTGSTRGIGYAIAERLIADGMTVTATGTGEDGHCPKGAAYHQVDLTDEKSLRGFLEFLKVSKIDVLVNNAGINKIGKFEEIEIEDFDKILSVNLRAPFLLCQAVIPYMKTCQRGRIVNITSIFGNISKEYRASYSSSKFGLDGMTAALSAEVSAFGILANSVGPGFIDTDLTRNVLGQEGIKILEKRIPMKRLGQANEIASLVSWLVSKDNTYLTGQNLIIDGGFSRV